VGFTFRAVAADSAYGDQDGFRSELPDAGLPFVMAEVTRIYGIRHWTGQSCKVKHELGWAGFQVRSDIAIRRHQALVNCAFSFCWAVGPPPPGSAPDSRVEGGRRWHAPAAPGAPGHAGTQLAPGAARRPQLADPGDHAHALVAGLVESAPAR
jgi:hypothetical protein